MEFKGTRGNFRFKYVSGFIRIIDEDGNNVIDTPWKHLNEANAKLIVAAPEMFEMLKATIKLQEAHLKSGCNTRFININEIEQLLTKITE